MNRIRLIKIFDIIEWAFKIVVVLIFILGWYEFYTRKECVGSILFIDCQGAYYKYKVAFLMFLFLIAANIIKGALYIARNYFLYGKFSNKKIKE